MQTLLVTPPSTQLNTPYPATAYLSRVLRQAGHRPEQVDLGIELVARLFSQDGLAAVFSEVEAQAEHGLPQPAWEALALRERHLSVVEPVVGFLRGADPGAATGWTRPGALPLGPRLSRADRSMDRFGPMGVTDRARYLCTLYLEDLADLITAVVDPGFGFSRYQHHLAHGPVSFDPIAARLAETSLPDAILDELVDELTADGVPDVVGITVPFPGTLYGALRVGARFKKFGARVVLGGGYVSTELREVEEPRLFECTDALVYDDGEGPLLAILEHWAGGADRRHRTRTLAGLHENKPARVAFVPAADYTGLDLSPYLQVLDTLNPAHRLWSDGRWNKITLAHGCYWKRCAFCDVHLDYVARFEPARVAELLDHIAEVVEQTGTTGFHCVDEAAPPRVMRDLALGLLARGQQITWWGNIRFEAAFTPDLCRLLAAAGLVAVTGGLEVASDRLLALMDKGITVEQAARAAHAFSSAGVLVHAYLMYGFPTQTEAETVDAAEVVRQMLAVGVLTSGFWHRFVLTRHSEVFASPERFQISYDVPARGTFATNDLPHEDPTGGNHDRFDGPLAAALSSWMAGRDLDQSLAHWMDGPVPSPASAADRIERALPVELPAMRPRDRLVFIGDGLLEDDVEMVIFDDRGGRVTIGGPTDAREWLAEVLHAARPGEEPLRFADARGAFPGGERAWRRWSRRWWADVRRAGLLGV